MIPLLYRVQPLFEINRRLDLRRRELHRHHLFPDNTPMRNLVLFPRENKNLDFHYEEQPKVKPFQDFGEIYQKVVKEPVKKEMIQEKPNFTNFETISTYLTTNY